MQGLLLIDKPADWTSFDVVNYVRKMVAQAEDKKPKNVKVGHTGTLDPFATGLLVLLIGKEYTKKAGQLSKMDKTYEVTMKLGETSSTGDPEGEITPYKRHLDRSGEILSEAKKISRQARNDKKPTKFEIEEALKHFTGEIEQVPPAYSAIKINGQRAYKLARAGKEVNIEPRQVTINRLELTNYSYPEVQFNVDVSSGTYIRSLVKDIGDVLGTGAYTTMLRRTKVGSLQVTDAQVVQKLDLTNQQKVNNIITYV